MKFNDELWIKKWEITPYDPIIENYDQKGIIVGTDQEPKASLCMASFANAMGDFYKEGMKILDYGCGSARFANFLSQRLQNFSYIGLERKESDWGVSCINKAKELFENDPRVNVGYVGSDIDNMAIETCEVVLLLSVFTHTTIEETEIILKKLLPIVDRGGCVIFSVIFGNKYELRGSAYGFLDNYNITYNTKQQIEDLKIKLKVKMDLIDTFNAGVIHSIYKMTKN